MKRIIGFFLLLALVVSSSFANGQQEAAGGDGASVGRSSITALGLGYNQTNYKLGYDSDSTIDTSIYTEKIKVPAFDINLTSFTSKKSSPFTMGFLYDVNFMISSAPTYEVDDDGDIYSEDLSLSEGYGTGFGVQMILGPGFNAQIVPSLSVQMGLGAHVGFSLMPSELYYNDNITGFGLGIGSISRLNWQFAPKMGLMIGLDMSYDFLSLLSGYDIDSLESGSGSTFSISPLIMISFSNFGGSTASGSVADSGKSGSSGSGSSSSSGGSVGGVFGGDSSSSKPKKPSADKSEEWDSDPYD